MIKIDEEFKKLIPALQEEEYKILEQELIKEGKARDALIIWNNTLIDGHNRYEICTKHNLEYRTENIEFLNRDDAKVWIIDHQFGRRNLSAYDRSVLALKKEDILRLKAKQNQGTRTDLTSDRNLTKVDVKKELAKTAGVSHDTIMKVKKIQETATPEQKKDIQTGRETINSTYTKIVKQEKREEIVKKIQKTQDLPDKKYGIIYADPAWKYFETGNHNQSQHYKTMTIDEIKALPVKDIAADDCVLFLWVTFPILEQSFEVIKAWGFTYSTCAFNWIKNNKKSEGYFFGLGQWTRANSELCLLATRGQPQRKSNLVSQIINTPLEEHSKKPDIVRTKIVELMGEDLPRIELFARQKTKGWDTWGNEVD